MQLPYTQDFWREIVHYLEVESIATLYCTFDRKLQLLLRQKGTIHRLTFFHDCYSKSNSFHGQTRYLLNSLAHVEEIELFRGRLHLALLQELMRMPITTLWIDSGLVNLTLEEWYHQDRMVMGEGFGSHPAHGAIENSLDLATASSTDPLPAKDESIYRLPTFQAARAEVDIVFPDLAIVFPQLKRLQIGGEGITSMVSTQPHSGHCSNNQHQNHASVQNPLTFCAFLCSLPHTLELLHIYSESCVELNLLPFKGKMVFPPSLTDLVMQFETFSDLPISLPLLVQQLPLLQSLRVTSFTRENVPCIIRSQPTWPPHLTRLEVAWHPVHECLETIFDTYNTYTVNAQQLHLAWPETLQHLRFDLPHYRGLTRDEEGSKVCSVIQTGVNLRLLLPPTITILDLTNFNWIGAEQSSKLAFSSLPGAITSLEICSPTTQEKLSMLLKCLNKNCPNLSRLSFHSENLPYLQDECYNYEQLPRSLTYLCLDWQLKPTDRFPTTIRRLRCGIKTMSDLMDIRKTLPNTLMECINRVLVDLDFCQRLKSELKSSGDVKVITTDNILQAASRLVGGICRANLNLRNLYSMVDTEVTTRLDVIPVSSKTWLWYNLVSLVPNAHNSMCMITTMHVELGRAWWSEIEESTSNTSLPPSLTCLHTGRSCWPPMLAIQRFPKSLTEIVSSCQKGTPHRLFGEDPHLQLCILDVPLLSISYDCLLANSAPGEVSVLRCNVFGLSDEEAKLFPARFPCVLTELSSLSCDLTGALVPDYMTTVTLSSLEAATVGALKAAGLKSSKIKATWKQVAKVRDRGVPSRGDSMAKSPTNPEAEKVLLGRVKTPSSLRIPSSATLIDFTASSPFHPSDASLVQVTFSPPLFDHLPSSLTSIKIANIEKAMTTARFFKLLPASLQSLCLFSNPYIYSSSTEMKDLPRGITALRLDGEASTFSKYLQKFDLTALPSSLTSLSIPHEELDLDRISVCVNSEPKVYSWPVLKEVTCNSLCFTDSILCLELLPALNNLKINTLLVKGEPISLVPTTMDFLVIFDSLNKALAPRCTFEQVQIQRLVIPPQVEQLVLSQTSDGTFMSDIPLFLSPDFELDVSKASSLKSLSLLGKIWIDSEELRTTERTARSLLRAACAAPALESLRVEFSAFFNDPEFGPELPRTLTSLQLPKLETKGLIILKDLPLGLKMLEAPKMFVNQSSPPPPPCLIGNIRVASSAPIRTRVVLNKKNRSAQPSSSNAN